jgi:hypothetical protein
MTSSLKLGLHLYKCNTKNIRVKTSIRLPLISGNSLSREGKLKTIISPTMVFLKSDKFINKFGPEILLGILLKRKFSLINDKELSLSTK